MKISHLAILALVPPIALAAQQPTQPPAGPPANPITTTFRTRITNLHRNIAQAFDSIPASKFSYKPTPAQLSIGFIAAHIANDDYFFCNNFGAMKGTRPAEDTATADSVKATWPKDKLVASLKNSFAFCDQAIAQVDDAKLADQISEHADEAAGTFSTVNEALMGRLNELKGNGQSSRSSSTVFRSAMNGDVDTLRSKSKMGMGRPPPNAMPSAP